MRVVKVLHLMNCRLLSKSFFLFLLFVGLVFAPSFAQQGLFDSDDPAKEPFSVPLEMIEDRINSDPSSDGIKILFKYPNEILDLDIYEVPGDTSAAAVIRVIFMTGRLAEQAYEKMSFSDEGEKVFWILAEDIQSIGSEFVWGEERKGQNAIVLIRRFADALKYPDGTRVAPDFTGSLLGDARVAMKIINEKFHPEWTLKTTDIK